MSEELAKRIDKAIAESGLSKAEIARKLDVTPQAVNGWVKKGKITKEYLAELSGLIGTTPNKLLFGYESPGMEIGEGKGEPYLFLSQIQKDKIERIAQETGETFQEATQRLFNLASQHLSNMADHLSSDSSEYIGHIDAWDSNTPLDEDEVELPYFMDVELAAGIGADAVTESNGPKLRFSKSTLRRCGVDESSAACVKVSGNSMEPRLYDGDVVGVNTADTSIIDGKTCAINHDGLLRVKRLYRLPGGGVRVNSMNSSEYPDETYSSYDTARIKVIGRVFWHSSIW